MISVTETRTVMGEMFSRHAGQTFWQYPDLTAPGFQACDGTPQAVEKLQWKAPEPFHFDAETCYTGAMDKETKLTPEELAVAKKLRLEAMHLQVIESNPFDAEDVALFDMFDRERWSHEKRIEYIREMGKQMAQTNPAQ